MKEDGSGAAEQLDLPSTSPTTIGVTSFQQATKGLLVGTNGGLYRLNADGTGTPEEVTGFSGSVRGFQSAGNALLVGEGDGLYRLKADGSGVAEKLSGFSKSTFDAFQPVANALFVGSSFGLYRLDGIDGRPWQSEIKIDATEIPHPLLVGNLLRLKWQVLAVPFRANLESVTFRVYIQKQEKNQKWKTKELYEGKFVPEGAAPDSERELNSPLFTDTGYYRLRVVALDALYNESKPTDFPLNVYSEFSTYWEHVVEEIGIVISILHLLFFTALIVGARWSQTCFDLLNDPVLGKARLYFGPLLTYVTPIRLWVFELYFHKLSRLPSPDHSYLSVTLLRPDKTAASSDDLFEEIRTYPRIWIHGGPGSGKSEAVREMLRLFGQEPSIEKAWRSFSCVPLFANVRDYLTTPGIEQMARGALASFGVMFPDEPFFSRLLRRGGFLLILDGMNEAAERESDVRNSLRNFSVTYPKVRVLVTSQSEADRQSSPDQNAEFQQYEIPTMFPDFAHRLLDEFLRSANDKYKVANLSSELWKHIISGYDAYYCYAIVSSTAIFRPTVWGSTSYRLNVPLRSLPVDRQQSDALYRKVWEMFKDGSRSFSPDEMLMADLVDALTRANVVVRRREDFSFRHDLMRAYLAACWLMREAPDWRRALEEKTVWDLSDSDQRQLFSFVAQLADSANKLNELAQLAAESVATRFRLMDAVQDAGVSRGVTIAVLLSN